MDYGCIRKGASKKGLQNMFYVNRWLNIPTGAGLRVLIVPDGAARPEGEATANEYYHPYGAAQFYSTITEALKVADHIRDAWETDLKRSVGSGHYTIPQVYTVPL